MTKEIQVFTDGDQLYDAMINAIESAKDFISMESYIFASDAVGWSFAYALAKKGKEGLNVRLLVDSAGSFLVFSREMRKYLKKNNVKVRFFHHWSFREPFKYNHRNHRKLLIVDNKIAFLGGYNIHKESSFKAFGKNCWRDTHIAIEQPLLGETVESFDKFWKSHFNFRFRNKKRRIGRLGEGESKLYQAHLRYLYKRAWPKAKDYIYMTTPYFVPDFRTQHAIIKAAEKGIDVRLLVPKKSDIKLTQWAARAAYAHLLHSGVRIYEYLPRMLHAKTVIIDDTWASVGTANMDYRSFFLNHEIVLLSRNKTLCAELKSQFMHDILQSEEVIAAQWPKRPLSHRIAEAIGWIARRWL